MNTTQRRAMSLVLGLCTLVCLPMRLPAAEVAKSPHGPDDEVGVLNSLTAAQSLAVLQRVNSGKVYDLSVDYFVGMPGLADLGMGDPPFHMWLTHTPSGVRVEKLSPAGGPLDLALYDDAFIMSTHSGTHFDSLNHIGYGDKIFNGFDAARYLGNKGWTKAGADKIPPMITRGILLDIATDKGVAMLPDSYEITVEDIQRTLTRQGITMQQGDAVLIRTGRMTVWPDAKKFVPNEPGITKESAAWLIDHGAVLLGADTMGVEKFPMAKESVHAYAFAERGVCLLELAWLEDLAKDKVYEFAFIAAPLKLRGATGAPARPLALPIRSESTAPELAGQGMREAGTAEK
ncbi:MAG: cyclase family protein [Candidatus Binatia bacterium]